MRQAIHKLLALFTVLTTDRNRLVARIRHLEEINFKLFLQLADVGDDTVPVTSATRRPARELRFTVTSPPNGEKCFSPMRH